MKHAGENIYPFSMFSGQLVSVRSSFQYFCVAPTDSWTYLSKEHKFSSRRNEILTYKTVPTFDVSV